MKINPIAKQWLILSLTTIATLSVRAVWIEDEIPQTIITVTASSEYSPAQSVRHLVDGEGMQGRLHDNSSSSHTMWHSSERPTPTSQSTLTPRTSPSVQTRTAPSMRGLEPPPTVDVARIYLHSGRQQLNRRDWAGAQEALELALPLLEKNEAADCKVMLGWAIFNNNANPEAERIERPKAMWNEVATQFAKTPFHAQAAYYLAIWHKLHGELRHVMGNLQICLNLQPNHIEAAREKRLMEQRRSNLSELGELEDRERGLKSRRASKTAIAASKPTPAVTRKVALPKEQSWLEKLFGGDKK